MKNKWIAVILSFFFGGFAYIYTWDKDKFTFLFYITAFFIVWLGGSLIRLNIGTIAILILVVVICFKWIPFFHLLFRKKEVYDN